MGPVNPCRLLVALKGWLTGLNVLQSGVTPEIIGFRGSGQLCHRVPPLKLPGRNSIFLREEFPRDVVSIRWESVTGEYIPICFLNIKR